MNNQVPIDIRLHSRQAQAFDSVATEILYGGAAGGGKSHLMRSAAIVWCAQIPGLQVYLFRRLYPDLVKNHVEGPSGFRAMLAPWEMAGFVKIVDEEIRFWNGSKIYLCHCKDEKDRFKYQGAEIHVLMIDELTHFTEVIYRFLRGRVRAVGLKIPAELIERFPRILCSSNPGNVGHAWVKAAFIDDAQPMDLRRMDDSEGGMLRQFIPARLDDNPSMAANDPTYRARLRGLGSEALVRAMEEGDWDVIDGAFFTEFSRERHVVKPFKVPAEWARFRSFDWGSAKPFSVGWWAIASDDVSAGDVLIPRGSLVRYREWYGAQSPNVGLKLTAEQVAQGIVKRQTDGEKFAYSVADPAIFTADGGPSIAERMHKAGVSFRHADNKRVTGWDQLRDRLRGDDETPAIFFFSTCMDTIRTLPGLMHDEARPEDLDTDGEDHAADDIRYACMSRPYVREVREKPKLKPGTLDYILKVTEEPKRRSRYRA